MQAESIDPAETFGWPLCEKLAGPRPSGDWDTNPLDWSEWEAKWRAGVRSIRARAAYNAVDREPILLES